MKRPEWLLTINSARGGSPIAHAWSNPRSSAASALGLLSFWFLSFWFCRSGLHFRLWFIPNAAS